MQDRKPTMLSELMNLIEITPSEPKKRDATAAELDAATDYSQKKRKTAHAASLTPIASPSNTSEEEERCRELMKHNRILQQQFNMAIMQNTLLTSRINSLEAERSIRYRQNQVLPPISSLFNAILFKPKPTPIRLASSEKPNTHQNNSNYF